MPQTVFGQTDALALAVVAWLTAQAALQPASAFCLPITVKRRYWRLDELSSSIPNYDQPVSIDVIPGGESSSRKTVGPNNARSIAPVFESKYGVNLVIQQKMTGVPDQEAQCGLLMQLRSQIIEGLKGMRSPLALTGAVHPGLGGAILIDTTSDNNNRPYDLVKLENERTFYSEFVFVFSAPV